MSQICTKIACEHCSHDVYAAHKSGDHNIRIPHYRLLIPNIWFIYQLYDTTYRVFVEKRRTGKIFEEILITCVFMRFFAKYCDIFLLCRQVQTVVLQ